MIGTLLTLVVCAILLVLSQWWWRSHLNPVTIGILAWTPALVMLNWPPFFLSPYYIHLNRPISPLVYLAMAISIFSFWGGCALVKAMSPQDAFTLNGRRMQLNINMPRALFLFGIGVAIFAYSYLRSGLIDLQNLDEQQVAESRLNLHLGVISFATLFMDVIAIGLFARFLQTGRLVFVIPMMIALICEAATLQKSAFMLLVIASIFVAALHPKATLQYFWNNLAGRIVVFFLAIGISLALLGMNQARGIAVVQMTAASSPVIEQMYIYSGASAIMNVSLTLDGYLPTDQPAMGLYLARPILWHFVDRDLIFATRHFEGINGATYMIYGWADFWWLGFFALPFLTGAIVMIFLRFALTGTLAGLFFGVIQAKAVILSANTDVIFDPTTLIFLTVSLIAYYFTRVPQRRMALPQPRPPRAVPVTRNEVRTPRGH